MTKICKKCKKEFETDTKDKLCERCKTKKLKEGKRFIGILSFFSFIAVMLRIKK